MWILIILPLIIDAPLLQVDNSASAPLGGQPAHSLTKASKHLPVWSGICPGYLQSYEVIIFLSFKI